MTSDDGTRVLLTGAGGFIGSHLLAAFSEQGDWIRAVTRGAAPAAAQAEPWPTSGAPSDSDLDACCDEVQHCYHLAGIAHAAIQGDGTDSDALRAFNVDLTLRLYQAAVRQGCQSFVWLSSSKVLGDTSSEPLNVAAPYAAVGSYAESKVEAERALLAAAVPETRLVILRAPLVYGPRVGANFERLLAAALGRWPLPLGSARAERSLIGVKNLCSALLAAAIAPTGVYQVADRQTVSVAQLFADIAACADRSPRLFPCPPALARVLLTGLGRGAEYQRLFASLVLDTHDSEARLNWQPPHTREQQLRDTVSWFQSQR